jgi:hypothetical protein
LRSYRGSASTRCCRRARHVFDLGRGRKMKQWLSITSPALSWVELAKETTCSLPRPDREVAWSTPVAPVAPVAPPATVIGSTNPKDVC